MQDRFRCSVKDLLIAIGPSIRWCCYEVGEDVNSAFRGATGKGEYFREQGKKYFIDLSSANKIQALKMGVSRENLSRQFSGSQ